MSTILKNKIVTAKKEHYCDAFNFWLPESIRDIIDKLTYKEKRAIVRMKMQNGKIIPGQKYIYQVGIYYGDFYTYKADIEIDAICNKFDLFDE